MSGPQAGCQRAGCHNSAAFQPIITIWPAGHPEYTGAPAIMTISLSVCAEHATESAAVDLLAHGFDYLRVRMQEMGWADPDPDRTSIRWERIQ